MIFLDSNGVPTDVSTANPLPVTGGGGGGGGDASAANQTTEIARLTSILAGMSTGSKQDSIITALGLLATATAQTAAKAVFDQIATNTAAATPAGTNTIGAVLDLSKVVTASAITRPADTNIYASGDLIANSTTAGSVTPISITITRANDTPFTIFRARLLKSSTPVSVAQFRVHLFNVSPVVVNGDNGALSTTGAAGYLGYVDIDMSQTAIFSDGGIGTGQPNSGAIILKPASGAQNIYALIESRAAYTPTSGETFTLSLEGTQS